MPDSMATCPASPLPWRSLVLAVALLAPPAGALNILAPRSSSRRSTSRSSSGSLSSDCDTECGERCLSKYKTGGWSFTLCPVGVNECERRFAQGKSSFDAYLDKEIHECMDACEDGSSGILVAVT
eukprot:gene8463-1514_t